MPRSPQSPPKPWLAWIQLGLSTMLAVLFVVLLARSREQSLEIQQLQGRIQTLENSRNLEQAADQNSQLRVLSQRLQDLETQVGDRIERSESERLRLQQLLSDLRGRQTGAGAAPQQDNEPPAPPRPSRAAATPLAPVLRPAPSAAPLTGSEQ